MAYSGKLKEKQKAIRLRKQGLSYSEIQKEVGVSKDTLSRWCRDIVLSPKQLGRLRKKRLKGAEKGRIIGAKKQQQLRIERTAKLINEGKRDVGKLTGRERFIAGIALYLGDGYKGDNSIGFSNSNPKIIRFMMQWLRDFCDIPENKFRGQIWIHENQNEKAAKKYWSKLTKIKIGQFQKSYIAKNKKDSKKIRKAIHKHGVFAVRVFSSEKQRKILGWMAGILGTNSI